MENAIDDNPRPLKRPRFKLSEGCRVVSEDNATAMLPKVPPANLLLALPSLLIHPPTHKLHTQSLLLSLHALRRCLTLEGLEEDLECRAYTAFVEIGLKLASSEPEVDKEVEKSLTRGLLIAQKYPSLRSYKSYLTLLGAEFSLRQGNLKFAQNNIRRLLTSFLSSSDPPNIVYSVHLGLIDNLMHLQDASPQTHVKVLGAIQDLHSNALRNHHKNISLLASVLRLRVLIQNGKWDELKDVLNTVEADFGVAYPSSENSSQQPQDVILQPAVDGAKENTSKTPIEIVLTIHLLIMSIIFHTYAGDAAASIARLKYLHELLDGGALDAFGPHGIIEIPFKASQPLYLHVTHPRVIYILGFLVSSVAKRDPVGRKPKRRVFATEGLAVLDREMRKEIEVPTWASHEDLQELDGRMKKMKADMMSELVGVSIMRSEFDEAEIVLAQLIAHTRTHNLFSMFAARITLHHAQLAHALSKPERALQCYEIAAYLSRKRTKTEESDDEGYEDIWINTAARAGEVWVRLGMLRADTSHEDQESRLEELRKIVGEVAKECDGLGGTLGAIGEVLKACFAKEFLKAKGHLRRALQLATSSQDNHLRALVLSLIASHYIHTATEHAQTMLGTADQLAAGLGAQPRTTTGSVVGGDRVGNAQLRLWIGERLLEMDKRAGNEIKVVSRALINDQLKEAVERVEKRPISMVG